MQKEEQFIKEHEKKEAERERKEEEAALKTHVASMKTMVAGLRERAKKKGESVRNWFGLFDTNQNNSLDLSELTKVLQHAGLRLPEADVAQLFRLLDTSGDGQVAYHEFCSAIEGAPPGDDRLREFAVRERAK